MRLVLLSIVCCLIAQSFCDSPYINFGVSNVKVRNEDITLDVQPKLLHQSGDFVAISFSGVPNPDENDLVALYTPSDLNPQQSTPVKWKYCTTSSNYLTTGSGSVFFSLTNMFADYAIAFFRNGTDYPVLASHLLNAVTFRNLNEPSQAHLALTGDRTQMRLDWATGIVDSGQHVQYGPSHDSLHFSAIPTISTYTKNDLCGGQATTTGYRFPGYFYSAVMTNLQPNTKYFYRFGSENTSYSQISEFVSAPVPTTPVQFAVFGDMGKGEIDGSIENWQDELHSVGTTNSLFKHLPEISFAYHIGDISYAVGIVTQWFEFMSQIEPISERVPYMVGIGNHERDWTGSGSWWNRTDSGGECGVAYEHHFTMPTTGTDKPWYSFNYGNVHLTMMSTEHDFRPISEQFAWLENDLQNVDRSVTPWLIFSGHRAMYVDSNDTSIPAGDQTVAQFMRDNLEDLLIKYNVDLALWGHLHSYQRTCHVYNEKCGQDALPVHVIVGMAGFDLDDDFEDEKPEYMEIIDNMHFGFSMITTTDTSLHFQFLNNDDDTVLDQFWLYK